MKNTDIDPDYKPHENEYLRKKRINRNKTLFSKKIIYRLMLMSILLCGAFVIWAEQTGFEGDSLLITSLGFFMMFAAVIGLALVGAVLLLVVRKLRRTKQSSFLDHEISKDDGDEDEV